MVSDLWPEPRSTCFYELLPQGLGSCYFLCQELCLIFSPFCFSVLQMYPSRLRLNSSYATEQSRFGAQSHLPYVFKAFVFVNAHFTLSCRNQNRNTCPCFSLQQTKALCSAYLCMLQSPWPSFSYRGSMINLWWNEWLICRKQFK